jgi:succinate dehydrogenase / fumarate reductase, cytochrome b subunit
MTVTVGPAGCFAPSSRLNKGPEMNLLRSVRSSLGSKYLMAITGLALIGFVIAHMSSNLLIFVGRDALNSYAATLKDKPALLWSARLVLLAIFVVHVALGLRLTWQNQLARPIAYVYERTVRANWASRHMLLTGLVLLAFVVYHLAHFTFGVITPAEVGGEPRNYLELAEVRDERTRKWEPRDDVKMSQPPEDKEVRQDVYRMVVSGFRNPWVSASYLVAMIFLGLHLWHGGSSWFQSLGLDHPRYRWLTRGLGPFVASVVVVGNCSIPLAVLLGAIK